MCVCVCVCVCVLGGRWARLLLRLEGGAKVIQGTTPQRSFQMPTEGPDLPAFGQGGVAGSNHAYAVPGATGLCLGNAWQLINGSRQCSNWKLKLPFSRDFPWRSLLEDVTAAHDPPLPGSRHLSHWLPQLPNQGDAHWLQTGLESCSAVLLRVTLGTASASQSLSEPICPVGIWAPQKAQGRAGHRIST